MKSKFTWIFTLLFAFFIQFAFAQQKTVTGIVTDNEGLPAPGVSVMVKGNAASAVYTDLDGKYSISASASDRLVFTYLDSVTERPVGNSAKIDVSMGATELGEVVITNYKTTARPLSTDAVTTVTAKTIGGRPNASFIQTLQAQVPGLNISTGSGQPGANSTVILRGYGSINGNVEPLYVIDNVPVNVDNFRSLNPNDIETISVLKDAGATAIYGNRGANGVIVITTKKGSFESPLTIKYQGITSFTEMQNNKYRMMNSRQLLGLEKAFGSGYGTQLTDEEIAAYPTSTNWKDELFRTGVSQSHTLSLSSGGQNLTSFTSLGYFDQEGILANTDLKRFSFRNNMSGRSSDNKFNYNTSLTFNYSQSNQATGLGNGYVNLNPVVGANNGLPYLTPGMYTNGADLLTWYTSGTNPNGVPIPNNGLSLTPLFLLNQLETYMNKSNEIKAIANISASYKLTDDLKIGASFGSDFTEIVGLSVYDPASFTEQLYQVEGQDYLGTQSESFSRDAAFNVNTNINWSKSFGNHSIDVSAFTEYYKAHYKTFGYTQSGLDPKVFSPGNGAGFIAFNAATPNFYIPDVSSSKGVAGLFSYFATADYDYSEKYGFSGTVRRDASYRFASTNRWGTFWSVAGRWNLDKEDFMENSGFNLLKLRASYGSTGNQNIAGQSIYNGATASRTLYGLAPTSYSNMPAYGLAQLGNADLKWETTKQANIGVEWEVMQQRLRGTVEFYNKRTEDLYQTISISGVNGTYGIAGNFGTMQNRGVELQLAYDLVRTQDFNFTLNFNGSYNKNKILELPLEVEGDVQIQTEGHAFNEFYAIKYAGVNPANGNLLFYTADGQLTENPDPDSDKVFTGKTFFPTFQGGFGFDASYKGFFLTTQFSYVADIWRYDYDLETIQDPTDIGVMNQSTDLLNAWTVDNRITDIPSLNLTNKDADTYSDRYLKDASYVRLRYASLGYQFNRETLAKTPLTGLRAYFQAENLFTLTKWRGWDAESNRASDVYQYPTPRILSIGLEVEF